VGVNQMVESYPIVFGILHQDVVLEFEFKLHPVEI